MRVREGRKSSGVVRRPVSLLVDSPDATALFDRLGRVLLANEAALAEGTPGPGTFDGAPDSAPPFWLSPLGRDSLIEATAVPGGARNFEVRIPAGPETSEATRRAAARSGASLRKREFMAVSFWRRGAVRHHPGDHLAPVYRCRVLRGTISSAMAACQA